MTFTNLTSNVWNATTDKCASISLTTDTTLTVTGEKGILKVTTNGFNLFISGRKRLGIDLNSDSLLSFVNVNGVLYWDVMPTELNESAPETEQTTNLNFNGVTIPNYVSGNGFGGVKICETINIAECTRINQNANLKAFQFNFRALPISGLTELFISIWRNNNGTFSRIHTLPITSYVIGNNELILPTSIAVLQGDYISIGYSSTTVQPAFISMCADSVGARYVTSIPTTDFVWLTKSQSLNYAPIVAIKE